MAYVCVLGRKTECDGCMKCQRQEPPILHCSWCDEELRIGEAYYLIGCKIVCEDCIEDCKAILE